MDQMTAKRPRESIELGDMIDKIDWHFDERGLISGHTAYVSEQKVIPLLAEIENLRAERDAALAERDAYAKAMAIALSEGIFANKAQVKRAIERELTQFKEPSEP